MPAPSSVQDVSYVIIPSSPNNVQVTTGSFGNYVYVAVVETSAAEVSSVDSLITATVPSSISVEVLTPSVGDVSVQQTPNPVTDISSGYLPNQVNEVSIDSSPQSVLFFDTNSSPLETEYPFAREVDISEYPSPISQVSIAVDGVTVPNEVSEVQIGIATAPNEVSTVSLAVDGVSVPNEVSDVSSKIEGAPEQVNTVSVLNSPNSPEVITSGELELPPSTTSVPVIEYSPNPATSLTASEQVTVLVNQDIDLEASTSTIVAQFDPEFYWGNQDRAANTHPGLSYLWNPDHPEYYVGGAYDTSARWVNKSRPVRMGVTFGWVRRDLTVYPEDSLGGLQTIKSIANNGSAYNLLLSSSGMRAAQGLPSYNQNRPKAYDSGVTFLIKNNNRELVSMGNSKDTLIEYGSYGSYINVGRHTLQTKIYPELGDPKPEGTPYIAVTAKAIYPYQSGSSSHTLPRYTVHSPKIYDYNEDGWNLLTITNSVALGFCLYINGNLVWKYDRNDPTTYASSDPVVWEGTEIDGEYDYNDNRFPLQGEDIAFCGNRWEGEYIRQINSSYVNPESYIDRVGDSYLAEFAYSTGASLDDHKFTEGYLAHKYGVLDLLPSSHPYKSTPPSGISFNPTYDVYAIKGPNPVSTVSSQILEYSPNQVSEVNVAKSPRMPETISAHHYGDWFPDPDFDTSTFNDAYESHSIIFLEPYTIGTSGVAINYPIGYRFWTVGSNLYHGGSSIRAEDPLRPRDRPYSVGENQHTGSWGWFKLEDRGTRWEFAKLVPGGPTEEKGASGYTEISGELETVTSTKIPIYDNSFNQISHFYLYLNGGFFNELEDYSKVQLEFHDPATTTSYTTRDTSWSQWNLGNLDQFFEHHDHPSAASMMEHVNESSRAFVREGLAYSSGTGHYFWIKLWLMGDGNTPSTGDVSEFWEIITTTHPSGVSGLGFQSSRASKTTLLPETTSNPFYHYYNTSSSKNWYFVLLDKSAFSGQVVGSDNVLTIKAPSLVGHNPAYFEQLLEDTSNRGGAVPFSDLETGSLIEWYHQDTRVYAKGAKKPRLVHNTDHYSDSLEPYTSGHIHLSGSGTLYSELLSTVHDVDATTTDYGTLYPAKELLDANSALVIQVSGTSDSNRFEGYYTLATYGKTATPYAGESTSNNTYTQRWWERAYTIDKKVYDPNYSEEESWLTRAYYAVNTGTTVSTVDKLVAYSKVLLDVDDFTLWGGDNTDNPVSSEFLTAGDFVKLSSYINDTVYRDKETQFWTPNSPYSVQPEVI